MIGYITAIHEGLVILVGLFINYYNESHFHGAIMNTLFTVNSDESCSQAKVIKDKIDQADIDNITSSLQKYHLPNIPIFTVFILKFLPCQSRKKKHQFEKAEEKLDEYLDLQSIMRLH